MFDGVHWKISTLYSVWLSLLMLSTIRKADTLRLLLLFSTLSTSVFRGTVTGQELRWLERQANWLTPNDVQAHIRDFICDTCGYGCNCTIVLSTYTNWIHILNHNLHTARKIFEGLTQWTRDYNRIVCISSYMVSAIHHHNSVILIPTYGAGCR